MGSTSIPGADKAVTAITLAQKIAAAGSVAKLIEIGERFPFIQGGDLIAFEKRADKLGFTPSDWTDVFVTATEGSELDALAERRSGIAD